jgi:hypothetical protein
VNRFHTSPIFPATEFSPLGERLFFAFCLWVSLSLIARIWILHRKDRLMKKIIWSAILMLPIMGWVFYAAFYNMLDDGTPRS